MLRISRLTDYATVLLAALAGEPQRVQTAAALAAQTHIAAPTVCKLLKQLQRAGLVISTRGLHGGYQLARPAAQISAAAILDALEGPVALTDCAAGHGNCEIEETCRVGRVWQRLNLAIRRALYDVSLAQLAGLDAAPARLPALEREMKAARRAPLRRNEGRVTTMSESAKQLETLIARGYQHGFVTDIDADTVPPGLDEDVVRLISRKKHEPAFLTEWRLKALRHWLSMKEPHWAHAAVRADRLPGDLVLLRAEEQEGRPEELSRTSIRSCSRPTRSSGCRCTSARASPASRSMRCSTACRSPRPSRSAWPPPAWCSARSRRRCAASRS